MDVPVGITVHPLGNRFYLVTENSTYIIGVSDLVLNLYWGPRLPLDRVLNGNGDDGIAWPDMHGRSSQDPWLTSAPEEYPVFGGLRYGDACLKMILPSGTRELDLQYKSYSVKKKANNLTLTLVDRTYPSIEVHLVYSVDVVNDIIARNMHVFNGTASAVQIELGMSAAWHLPMVLGKRRLIRLAGAWGAESQIQTDALQPGTHLVLSSTRGIPSAQTYPYMAIVDDENGHTYFGTLKWSGNWSMAMAVDIQGNTRWTGGISSHDFMVTVEPNAAWATPKFLAGFTTKGLSGARHRLPNHVLTHQLALRACRHATRQAQLSQLHREMAESAPKHLPVLYNSWEAAGFDINVDQQFDLATKARALGVELFVVDDGWFRGRNSDRAGLGDWFHDTTKFPDGLAPLANYARSLGMCFGLWFEPEMVNKDSDLYRAHPDWVYHYDDRRRSEARHQLVLNLVNKDVKDYLFERLTANIASIGIDYIKWDMNRPISEAGAGLAPENAKQVWELHVQGVYELMGRIKDAFPSLSIESCSSGGGRADVGILDFADQCWVSDNTRPDARLAIQHGISLVLPPRAMVCWVTDMGQSDNPVPLAFRCHVAFMGTLGIGSNLNAYTADQMKELAGWVRLYKKLRPVLQLGFLDWLHYDDRAGLAFTMTTDKNDQQNGKKHAIVLGFRSKNPFSFVLPRLRLKQLEEQVTYNLVAWTTYPTSPISLNPASGAVLMHYGIDASRFLPCSWSSFVLSITTA
ncbi:alpha-galactosidase [Gongronella butleri]|nr:alpha-galactosidase [Gongronella butleri]